MNLHLLRRRASRTGPRLAFSLIEVLAAMTILAILVLMAAQLFAGSAQFWKLGSRRIEQDMNARAALELVGRQIMMAVGDDDLLVFRVDEGKTNMLLGGATYATISMVTMDHQARSIRLSPTSSQSAFFRDVQQTQYAVVNTGSNAVLMRYGVYREYPMADPEADTPRYIKCYQNPDWAVPDASLSNDDNWPLPQVLCENVLQFEARVAGESRASPGTIPILAEYPYNSRGPSRPLWVDLTLSVVDDDDMVKAVALARQGQGVGNVTNLFQRSMRRYTYRAYLQNARGMDMK